MEHTGRREHPAQGGRPTPPPPPQKPPAAGRPAEELSAEEQRQRATNRFLAERYAKGLGITLDEVGRLWKADKEAFRDRLTNAGIDWRDGKAIPLTAMLDGPPSPNRCRSALERCQPAVARLEALKEGERYIPSTTSAFAVRRQTTDSLTVCPSIAGEAAQALDGPPVSEDERRAGILNALAAYQGQAGLTAGEAGAGAA